MSQVLDPGAKSRGAFFTPPEVADFLTRWAVRDRSARVLEPSCGEAVFLSSVGKRLRELGARDGVNFAQIVGVDIHEESVTRAAGILSELGIHSELRVQSFFDFETDRRFNAVVGNPPFIRYQAFSGAERAKALEACLREGVRLPSLTSSWAPFLVHAASFLAEDGRLAMVLPAELLSAKYAGAVRQYLLSRFRSIRLVLFDELIFPGVLEDTVLLLAEGRGTTANFRVAHARNSVDLARIGDDGWRAVTPATSLKWTAALIDEQADAVLGEASASGRFRPLKSWGQPYLGAVTGNNKFFTLTQADIRAHGLSMRDCLPISPPGSRHLPGLSLTAASHIDLVEAGHRAFLFYPREGDLSEAARRYIELGESMEVFAGYKCRNRDPWWRVPLVATPDLMLTYMNHDRPHFVANDCGAQPLNSVYGIRFRDQTADIGRDLLPVAAINSLTMLSGELCGRAYGGGLLKFEPREADNLLLPSAQLIADVSAPLRTVKSELAGVLRKGQVAAVANRIDEIVLERGLGLRKDQLSLIRACRDELFQRRTARPRRQGHAL